MSNVFTSPTIRITHQNLHPEIFGIVEITNDPLWRSKVIEAIEIMMAEIKANWKDPGLTLSLKLRRVIPLTITPQKDCNEKYP